MTAEAVVVRSELTFGSGNLEMSGWQGLVLYLAAPLVLTPDSHEACALLPALLERLQLQGRMPVRAVRPRVVP
jgi:hypothetical protein